MYSIYLISIEFWFFVFGVYIDANKVHKGEKNIWVENLK